jgi:hypothetical protein
VTLFNIRKKGLELEVVYQLGTVLINPIVYFAEYERSAHIIATSEQLLSFTHLKSLNTIDPYKDLKEYFESKGWEVIKLQ